MKNLFWKTEQRKVNDLLPLEINPRKISDERMQQLVKSIEKFNLGEIPAINTDNKILAGHQRVKALQLIGRGEEMIDVRVPNRKLNKKELKEYNLISNTHAGEWDFDVLGEFFDDVALDAIGIELPDVEAEIPEVEEDPFNDAGITSKNQYGVIVMCESEGNQEAVFKDLTGMGYKCKIVVT